MDVDSSILNVPELTDEMVWLLGRPTCTGRMLVCTSCKRYVFEWRNNVSVAPESAIGMCFSISLLVPCAGTVKSRDSSVVL
jgi:hypothetical protein